MPKQGRSITALFASTLSILLVVSACNATTTGTSSATPISSASATQSPTPAPFIAPIPISLPAPQGTGPHRITFDNIMDNIPLLPKEAWDQVQATIKSNPPTHIPTTVYTGPNTQYDVNGGEKRVLALVDRVARLWAGFTQVKHLIVITYSYKDLKWAVKTWKQVVAERNYPPETTLYRSDSFASNCSDLKCGGSNGGQTDGTGDGAIALGQEEDSTDIYQIAGGIIGHEYSHVVQNSQFLGTHGCRDASGAPCAPQGDENGSNGFAACWINEGLVNSAGNMVAMSARTYLRYALSRYYSHGPTTATDYSRSSLLDYLTSQGTVVDCYHKENQPYILGYSVGAAAAEALIAIAGPSAIMTLYTLGARGEDFATAFQHVYGISWEQGAKILSKVLAAEYKAAGPPPF